MIPYSGDYKEDATVYMMFNTFSSDDPSASCTITNFANTDVHIHKDDGLAQRNNAAGITVSVDFDGITGSHMIKIDTNDNTVAGFWVTGKDYFVRVEGTTVDGATINAVVGRFSIENRFSEVDVVKWLGQACAAVTVNGVPEVDITHLLGTAWLSPGTAGTPDVNAKKLGGTVQTGRDIGSNVLLSSGSGAGQLDFTSGVVKSNLAQILGTALTETAGWIAAGFKKLFNVATPVLVASDVMRGTDSANTTVPDAAGTAPTKTEIVDEWETQAAADPTGFKVNVMEINGTAQTANDNGADINSILSDTGTDGVVIADGHLVAAKFGADCITAAKVAADVHAEAADAVCDEVLTGETHNVVNSLGRKLREVGAYAIHSGTAQAGANISITLAAGASAIDGTYDRNLLVITDNTGVGQTRTIINYDGSTKIAIIDREWRTNPDATTVYQIVADDTPLVSDQGLAQAGSTSTTIKLRDYASSTNDIYLCNIVIIVAGTGRGQARLVGAYNGTTKVVTICGDNWTTTPDDTSVYVMIPYGASCACCICDYALGQINTECDTALTDINLDHLMKTAVANNADMTIEVADGTVLSNMLSKTSDTSTYAVADDSLEANRDHATTIKSETALIVGDTNELQTDWVNGGRLDLLLDAVKAKTDNQPAGIPKNVALANFSVLMVLSSDHITPATGKTLTEEISKDGGAFAACTNAAAEIGNGAYKISLTQAEMNADVIILKFTEANCDQRTVVIKTSS